MAYQRLISAVSSFPNFMHTQSYQIEIDRTKLKPGNSDLKLPSKAAHRSRTFSSTWTCGQLRKGSGLSGNNNSANVDTRRPRTPPTGVSGQLLFRMSSI